jgi:hypothetical protein
MAEKQTFNTKTAVQTYLIEQGYDITVTGKSKLNSKLSRHLSGVPRQGGEWLQSDIDFYAKQNWDMQDGVLSKEDQYIQQQIKREELKERKAKVKKLEFSNDVEQGKFVLLSEAEQQHTAKAALLLTGFESFVHSTIDRMIEIVDGDMSKGADLTELLLRAYRESLKQYSVHCQFSIPINKLKEIESLRDSD